MPEKHHATNGIYSPAFLQELFDDLQLNHYDQIASLTSFGLVDRWRKMGVEKLNLQAGMLVGDLMGGTGEAWDNILNRIGPEGRVLSVDFSHEMNNGARDRQEKRSDRSIGVIRADATRLPIEGNTLDAVYSGYGIKTLSPVMRRQFVEEMSRVLKPGGNFSFVEVAVPESMLLEALQRFYMYQFMPKALGLFDGYYEKFLMINEYLHDFNKGEKLVQDLKETDFTVETNPLCGGLATIISGSKPND